MTKVFFVSNGELYSDYSFYGVVLAPDGTRRTTIDRIARKATMEHKEEREKWLAIPSGSERRPYPDIWTVFARLCKRAGMEPIQKEDEVEIL